MMLDLYSNFRVQSQKLYFIHFSLRRFFPKYIFTKLITNSISLSRKKRIAFDALFLAKNTRESKPKHLIENKAFLVIFLFLVVINSNCSPKSPMEMEAAFFKDFLETKKGNEIKSSEDIVKLLYDIKYKGKTTGRAVHLGGPYFLTANHVVDGRIDNIQLIPQAFRSKTKRNSLPFVVLYYDRTSDLALLKAPELPLEEKSLLHLGFEIPKTQAKVVKFTYLSGKPLEKSYFLDFDGVDFYDKKIKIKSLGQISLPAGSLLYEVRGRIQNFKIKYFSTSFSQFHGSADTSCFSSILTYNGDSGSPVFEIVGANKYIFVGIITHSFGIGFEFKTPGHPMGFNGMQQAGEFFLIGRLLIIFSIDLYWNHQQSFTRVN